MPTDVDQPISVLSLYDSAFKSIEGQLRESLAKRENFEIFDNCPKLTANLLNSIFNSAFKEDVNELFDAIVNNDPKILEKFNNPFPKILLNWLLTQRSRYKCGSNPLRDLFWLSPNDIDNTPLLQFLKTKFSGTEDGIQLKKWIDFLAINETINLPDNIGRTPLMVLLTGLFQATPEQNKTAQVVLNMLFEKGANPNIPDINSYPILQTIKLDDPTFCYLLLKNKADPDAVRNLSVTALYSAISGPFGENPLLTIGRPVHCALLIAFGAKLTAQIISPLLTLGYSPKSEQFKNYLTEQIEKCSYFVDADKKDILEKLEERFANGFSASASAPAPDLKIALTF